MKTKNDKPAFFPGSTIYTNVLKLKLILMTKWFLPSKRKITGGIRNRNTKKKKYMRGRDFLPAHVGEPKKKTLRTRGGGSKTVALSANVANVMVNGKGQKAKILSVVQNRADSQFVRRNIITKGAVIETDLGKARVTSRPGQTGVVNAVFVDTPKAPASLEKK